jgi:hypothetical protein
MRVIHRVQVTVLSELSQSVILLYSVSQDSALSILTRLWAGKQGIAAVLETLLV